MAQNDPTIIIIGGPRPISTLNEEAHGAPRPQPYQDYAAARAAIDEAEAEGRSVEVR